MQERRGQKRHVLDSYNIHSDMTFATEVKLLDISIGGLSLKADKRLNMGCEYIVKIKARENASNLRGEVIWACLCDQRETPDGEVVPIYKAGFRFTHLSDENLSNLVELIQIYKSKDDTSLFSCQIFGQRLYRRLKLDVPAGATVLHNYEGCTVEALSITGMLMKSDFELEPEDKLPMKLILPENKTITFEGRVASCVLIADAIPSRYHVGLEFLDVSQTDKAKLGEFISLLDTTGKKLREYERVLFREDLLIDGSRMCTSMDISEGGLYISAMQPYEKNTVIDVTIPFKEEHLAVKGNVRYCQSGIGIGVMFIHLDNVLRAQLRRLIASIKDNCV